MIKIKKLRVPEIVIDTLYGTCPVQARGAIDGKPFYFRARGGGWSIKIGGKDVISNPDFYFYAPYPDENPTKIDVWDEPQKESGSIVDFEVFEFSAGWMPESAARSFIHTAAVLYANTQTE